MFHKVKLEVLEMPGIEPGASHMRSERSTTEPHPRNDINDLKLLN